MVKWYTADTHFGHAKIIKYCNRPFADANEMDKVIIQNWNDTVDDNDDVYHLGDFAFYGDPGSILQRLKGRKHFIWGNHDEHHNVKYLSEWVSSQPYLEIKDGKTNITLIHYGMRVWNKSKHGALQFYGHSHSGLPGNSQSVDVGVDNWDFKPVSLSQIRERLATLTPYSPELYRGPAQPGK